MTNKWTRVLKAEEDLIQIGWDLNFEYYHEPSGIFMSLYDISSKNAPVYNTTFNQEGYGNKEVSFEKVMEDVNKVENWFLNGGYKEFFTKIRAEEHTDDGVGGTAWVTQEQYDEASEDEGWKTSAGTFPLPNDLEYMIDSNLMISLYVYKDSIVKFEGREASKKVKSSSSLSVLPKLLDKVWYDYDEEDAGRYAQIGSWEIGLGGYDTGYEVSYNGTPIFSITEDNELKPFMSDDMLQEEFGFSYNDVEKTLKKHRDLKNIKMVNASKKHYFYIKEDFPAFDGDTRVAVIEEDENGEYFDWNYFDTYEEAEEFLKEMNKKVKASTKVVSYNCKADNLSSKEQHNEIYKIKDIDNVIHLIRDCSIWQGVEETEEHPKGAIIVTFDENDLDVYDLMQRVGLLADFGYNSDTKKFDLTMETRTGHNQISKNLSENDLIDIFGIKRELIQQLIDNVNSVENTSEEELRYFNPVERIDREKLNKYEKSQHNFEKKESNKKNKVGVEKTSAVTNNYYDYHLISHAYNHCMDICDMFKIPYTPVEKVEDGQEYLNILNAKIDELTKAISQKYDELKETDKNLADRLFDLYDDCSHDNTLWDAFSEGILPKGDDLFNWDDSPKQASANKKIKSFNLKDIITKIQDRYHELMDIGSWSDAEWFKKGEYAYIYIPVNKFDFRKNVTTGETDKEAVKALEELSGQKVEIIKIKATIKGPYDVMTADAKPTLVDVRFEDGQVWEDVNTEWLKHEPFGEDEEERKEVESKIVKKDNKYQTQSEKGSSFGTYDTKGEAKERLKQMEMFKHMKSSSIEDNRHMVERISDLLDSGFEQEEIINIVCNEFECEPQEVEQFLRKVTYASKVVSEREAGKDLNLAIRKANKVLKEEIHRWDIDRRDVAKSVAKNFEEITGVNIDQLFTKVDDKYGSVIENVNAKLFDKQIPKIYKWVKNNFKIDKYDYETMQQDSDFIDMITDELVDMVDIDKVEYDKR